MNLPSIRGAVQAVRSHLERQGLNLLISSAGVGSQATLRSLRSQEMLSVLATNAVGPLQVAKEFLPLLEKAAKGTGEQGLSCSRAAVINVCTKVGSIGLCLGVLEAPMYPYHASKAAQNMGTRCLVVELLDKGIWCAAIPPGWVKMTWGRRRSRRRLLPPNHDGSVTVAAAGPGGAGSGQQRGRREQPGPRRVCENSDMASPKVYVLQPWVTNLLVNYEQLDSSENLLAGQVLRVLSDSTAPDEPGVLQDAVLQVSDGSYHIRVVITSEALQAEENIHMQLRLSSLICRIIVLQKYTVCFREEARLEDCEFYLLAHQFIVLPMERQRVESSDGNQEPSVLQKIKELWLKSLAVKNGPGSEPSISQLIDAIGQNQLEVLKESAEECLDLRTPKRPATAKDEVPITQWEAERKKEQGEDTFAVPANILVIPPEEEAAACDASKADTSEAAPGKSVDGRTVPAEPSVVSQVSPIESTALSESSEGSLDNPWNRLPPISLTLNSLDERTCQHDLSLKTQQDVAADSNSSELIEPSSQGSPEGLLPPEPVQTSSPSLLCSYSSTSLAETGTAWAASAAEAACNAPCPARGPQVLGGCRATLLSLSPVFPVLPSSRLQSLPEAMPHREQADSSGTAFPPDPLKHGPSRARTRGGDAVGTKRKLLAEADQALPAPSGQQHPRGAAWDRARDTGRRLEPVSTPGTKKSRKEEMGLRRGEELEEEEEEQATAASGPSSRPEQRRALQPYVKEKPARYRNKAPSPEFCEQIRSVRISEAMLKRVCWIVADREED